MTSTKKNKKATGPPAANLRSNAWDNHPFSNRTTPDHNKFEALASDDDSIPSVKTSNKQFTELSASILDMNTAFNKRFDSIFDVLQTHQKRFDDKNFSSRMNSSSPYEPATTNRNPDHQDDDTNHDTSSPTLTDPTDTSHVDYKNYPEGNHGYESLPSNTGSELKHPPVTKSSSIDNDSKLPPTTDVTTSTGLPTHAPSLSTTPPNTQIFGQNAFSMMITGCTKIKYMSMETYLKDRTISNDTTSQIEKMYVDILMSLTFVFEQDLSFLPPYGSLGRDINFEEIFLRNLHGFTLQKCKSVFLRLGTILKSRLTSKTYINTKQCPKTAIIVNAHPLSTGWNILELILCDRLVLCGGIPDYDLDVVRTSLSFLPNESYTDFYVKTQHIINEYELCYRKKNLIPIIKITSTFIHELNRATEYIPLLTTYYQQLMVHIKSFGDMDNNYNLPFTIHDVYKFMTMMNATLVPSQLRPSIRPTTLPTSMTIQPPPTTKPSSSYDEFIACLEVTIDEDCINPTMCAKMTNNRSRCQACLIGFHRELDCYLRGAAFQPEALKRRIKIYNQVNGDKPPPGHTLRDYNPQGKEAVHDKSKKYENGHRYNDRPQKST